MTITTEAELRELLGSPMQRVLDKDRATFTPEHRTWIEASPFCLVATSDANGRCDVSPKGDPPGFGLVVDDTTLAIPERPGNKRADGFANILQNPYVGLIFFVPLTRRHAPRQWPCHAARGRAVRRPDGRQGPQASRDP